MKKLLTLFLSIIFAFGAIGLVGCGETETAINTDKQAETATVKRLAVQSVSAPVIGGKILKSYNTRSGQTGISKRISATVEPADAINKAVDYRIFWVTDAEKAEEPVSDYVVVEQDSDGSLGATITCIQPFGADVIVVQVITREGKFTSECFLTYEGLLSEMAITSNELNTVHTNERGDYYEVYTDNTYTFTVNMDNELHSVGAYDLSVSVGGNGTFGFAKEAIYSTSGFTPVGSNGSSPIAFYNLNDLANEFISVDIDGTIISVQVQDKCLKNYYKETSENRVRDVFLRSGLFVDGTLTMWEFLNLSYKEDFETVASLNTAENYSKAYFTVTVTDARTNVSETIKLWVETGVDSVSLSTQSIVF